MYALRIIKYMNNKCIRQYSTRNVMKLKERGMWQDLFPENSAKEVTDLLNAQPQYVYAGFDPTASSLHVGNLLILVNLLHWQRGGHNVLAVIGGATGRIGDPSGKNLERQKIQSEIIQNNLIGIENNIKTIFRNHETYLWDEKSKLGTLTILDNDSWYRNMSAVDLLGDAGRFLRMGTLLSRTSVQTRLQSAAGMSLTEFSYQLFQAYDWLHLFKKFGCHFQIGGNDQMGNIMSGHDLISKACKKPVYGLTLPLITTETGDKFGKSAGNAVWLSSDDTSAFNFYQFWIRTTDADVEKMLKLFTFNSVGFIDDLMRKHEAKPEEHLAQKYLAEKVTLLVHGEEGLKNAQTASEALYKGNIEALSHLKPKEMASIFQGATLIDLLAEAGLNMLDFSMKVGCFANRDDAIRIIKAGGFYINQKRVSNPDEILCPNVHFLANNVTIVRVGKRNYYIINWAK